VHQAAYLRCPSFISRTDRGHGHMHTHIQSDGIILSLSLSLFLTITWERPSSLFFSRVCDSFCFIISSAYLSIFVPLSLFDLLSLVCFARRGYDSPFFWQRVMRLDSIGIYSCVCPLFSPFSSLFFRVKNPKKELWRKT